ncbi:MAG: rod shape-determining protein MreC [Candidatus Levybacteria bacterium]|nr:rod shape-determining protein MreC [Candidatus Levybacteria bacterium]
MKKKENFAPIFIFFLAFSLIILGLIRFNFFNNLFGAIGNIFSPVQEVTFQTFQSILNLNEEENLKNLKEENINLARQLVNQEKLEKENSALRDQFQTATIKSTTLIAAKIIGAPNFVPGVTEPSIFILDVGKSSGIRIHDAVILKDNLVGSITEVTEFRSKVNLITNATSSFTAKTLRTGAIGVVRGEAGREMSLQNIMQEADIKEKDIIVTKGGQELGGSGYPPDLTVGTIISVEKKPSALFQNANIVSDLNFSSLSTVFVIKSQ